MNNTKENTPRQESIYDQSMADNYPLHKELETLSPQEFMSWLESEVV